MTSRHLLVTNDFPPKLGGIQEYLWELWRRLEPGSFQVHTTPYAGSGDFDARQAFDVIRSKEPVLLPYPWLAARLDRAAEDFGAAFHVIDPAVPLGAIGPSLSKPYAVVLHGAEVTVPGRLPGSRQALARVLANASAVVSAGEYALGEAERAVGRPLRNVVIPPGVDDERFVPAATEDQVAMRKKYGIDPDAPFILSVSRLVPRKGMDTLIAVASRLHRRYPNLVVCIAGSGRDRARLQRRIDTLRAPVRLLGRIPDEDKALLYSTADVFSMLCRNRWAGLEQEGFGIVFIEAAAAGTPQIAGRSGGADEAVANGRTGLIAEPDASIDEIADLFVSLLDDPDRRGQMSRASRERAITDFSYNVLSQRLAATLEEWAEDFGRSDA